MPYKGPLTEEQKAKRRAATLRWYHRHKAEFSDEQKARRRENARKAGDKYRAEHREELNAKAREAMRASRAASPTANVEACRRHRAGHREEIEARRRSKRQSDAPLRIEDNARRREHHHAHRDEANKKRKENLQLQRLTSPWTPLLHAARWRAKKRGIAFELTEAWAASRWTGRCEVTGLPFRLGEQRCGPKFWSPSIDQITPKGGYTPANCRFVLWAVNAMKHDGTDEDMLVVAEAIVRGCSRKNSDLAA